MKLYIQFAFLAVITAPQVLKEKHKEMQSTIAKIREFNDSLIQDSQIQTKKNLPTAEQEELRTFLEDLEKKNTTDEVI